MAKKKRNPHQEGDLSAVVSEIGLHVNNKHKMTVQQWLDGCEIIGTFCRRAKNGEDVTLNDLQIALNKMLSSKN